MRNEEIGLKDLLENSRQQLKEPFTKTQGRLLLILNFGYLGLVAIFLISEKIATGYFIPNPILGVIYILVGVTNLSSAIYSSLLLVSKKTISLAGFSIRISTDKRLETTMRWASALSVMTMSLCHMIGIGNPSSDAILTDFALGHSFTLLSAMLLGRTASFVWFLTVIGLLIYVTFVRNEYSYQYNYLTPAESSRYETALGSNQSWALARKETLQKNGLNPPKISRYFNIWLVFMLIAFLTAYFCLTTTLSVYRIIPTVTENIRVAINASNQQELEREREQSQAEEQRLLLRQETLSAELKALKAQINPHFLYNTLNYFYMKSQDVAPEMAEGVLKLAEIMRYSMQDDRGPVVLDEEINYMQQFIDLHQLRHSHQLFIDFSVAGPTHEKEIPPFLLIGLVENAFKHGKMNEAGDPLIIRIEATQTAINLFIANKKNRKQRVESNNIGLANLRRRLALTYDTNYSFRVDQDEDYFRVELSIQT
ncbi:sensor histidine kinase [Spirosoma arcticum]